MAIPEVLLNHDWDGYVCVKMSALAALLADLPGYSRSCFPPELRERIEGLFDERGDAILLRGTGREPAPATGESWLDDLAHRSRRAAEVKFGPMGFPPA